MSNDWKFGSDFNKHGLVAGADLSTSKLDFKVYQDETPFLKQAEMERQMSNSGKNGYKKFATIPDIVALEIDMKYGIDIHDSETISNPALMRKFKDIIKREYPKLLASN